METAALIMLRIVLAWMFLSPLKNLIPNWNISVNLAKIIIPFKPQFFAVIMIAVMIVGSISILFGIYAQLGALMLFVYTLMGVVVHHRLANQLAQMELSVVTLPADKKILDNAKKSGIIGHRTSAQKNIVIAAALLMIVLMGSGSFSVTGNLL